MKLHDAALTERQQELLSYIAMECRRGVTPVVDDLRRRMKYTTVSSLRQKLDELARREVIQVRGGIKGRQLVITMTAKGWSMVPGVRAFQHTVANALDGQFLLAGRICAGEWNEVIEPQSEMINGKDLFRDWRDGDYLLEADGDCLSHDGITHGDRVQMRPEIEHYNGDIVDVEYTDDFGGCHRTLKHIYHTPPSKTVELRPSNPQYKILRVPATMVTVRGVLVGHVHNGRISRKA